jgi:hypothetical protein
MMRKALASFGALIVAIVLASCGGGGGGDGGIVNPPPPPPTCPGNTFCLQSSSFSPKTLTVAAGSVVSWVNDLGIQHDVIWDTAAGRAAATAGDGAGDMGVFTAGTHTRKMATAGTFAFHCTVHPGMNATITVTP